MKTIRYPHQHRMVLHLLLGEDVMTEEKIMSILGWTRKSIKTILKELIEDGLVDRVTSANGVTDHAHTDRGWKVTHEDIEAGPVRGDDGATRVYYDMMQRAHARMLSQGRDLGSVMAEHRNGQ